MVVKKTGKGYAVYSKSGKKLSKTYPTKAGANKRLKEIEYFKKKK